MLPGLPASLTALGGRLDDIGFERTRRALAALALSVFVSFYLLIAASAPEGLVPVMLALALCYGVAFVAVVAEWFWARWYATGLCWSGVMVAIAALALIGWVPLLAIYGGLHGVVVLVLAGSKMAARYDLQEAWRQRYQMDEFGVARLRKTVTRSAASLPSLIMWALGPKEGEGLALAAGIAALVFAVTGLRGLIQLRSWGVLALAAAAALVFSAGHVAAFATMPADGNFGALPNLAAFFGSTLAFVLLAAAVIPFAAPMARFLRRRAR